MIRVGRIKDTNDKLIYEGFTPIVVMMKSSEYGSLSPYHLKDENGHIMENIWQFSKVYREVPETVQTYSRYNKSIIWKHPNEIHYKDDKITEEYKRWRKKGFENKFAVRYPVGYGNMSKCLFALVEEDGKKLDYIQARKKIYFPLYSKLVKKQQQFKELKERLNKGENLLILEVDGPRQESLDYYKEKYGVDDDFIDKGTILVTKKNMKIMLNDPKHPFGHGYCLAITLLWC